MNLLYEGSVKNIYSISNEEIEFEFTDAFSVFDWGRMPDTIAGKGRALSIIGRHFFSELQKPENWKKMVGRFERSLARLSLGDELLREALEKSYNHLYDHGLSTCFLKQGASENRLRVKKLAVHRPESNVFGRFPVYRYPNVFGEKKRMLPLEVVFRFGMPHGSSFKDRLIGEDGSFYAKALGFESVPTDGAIFTHPVVEFFSKLEETDRYFTHEQALHHACLTVDQLRTVYSNTALVALFLERTFSQLGLELWDGKLEWGIDENGEMILADSIGPDELRLTEPKTGVQLSKEFLRKIYRKSSWYEALSKAKKKYGPDWREALEKNVGMPPMLSLDHKVLAERLYQALGHLIVPSLFEKQSIEEVALQMQLTGEQDS